MPYFLILFLFCATLQAKDFGTFGEIFVIQENNLLEVLLQRLIKVQSDEVQQLEIKKTFVKKIENPPGIPLPKAKKERNFEFNPTISLQDDLKDNEGNIIIPKGTKVNPLDKTKLRKDLLFFDGSDPLQVSWAKKFNGIWILTNGKPLELEKQEKHPVYFDQAGYLTNTLEIQALPARVSQKGNRLKIEEIPCF
jgi:conjugal transfer pilus assembly protein TraW